MADSVRVWLELAFEGGQALRVEVTGEVADGLDAALARSGDGESYSFDADDARYTVALKKIVFVRRFAREATVGFGAAA